MSYAIRQSSEWDGSEGQDWWRWSVWIDADDAELDDVVWVEYRLHPTFTKPILRIADRESRFLLKTSGWGEFMIQARLRLKSSESDLELSHWLELTRPSGTSGASRGISKGEPPPPAPATRTKVMLSVGPGQEELADQVARMLKDDGVEVSTQDDILFGMPLEIQIEKMIGEADALVAVLGSKGSKWVERDVGVARSHSVPVLPVLVGESSELPSSIRDLQVLRLKRGAWDEVDARDVATSVKKMAQGVLRPSTSRIEPA